MATKSSTAVKPAETDAQAPATAPAYERSGRTNPLAAIMRLVTGKQPTAEESGELAKFLSGTLRLTDTHLYALSKFFSKRYHVQLSTLAAKVARYQSSQQEDLTVQAAKSALEDLCGVQFAEWDSIESNYSNEYERYSLETVKAAHSRLWDAYGRTGNVQAGLIDLANAHDRENRDARQAATAE